jgi:sec-independent protein translocase protein TatA
MFGKVGIWEVVIILGLLLVIFGPKKLPELGRSVGKTLKEFRRSSAGLDSDEAVIIEEDSPKTKAKG